MGCKKVKWGWGWCYVWKDVLEWVCMVCDLMFGVEGGVMEDIVELLEWLGVNVLWGMVKSDSLDEVDVFF